MPLHPINILVLLLGAWASYQDIRYKKVKNWLLLATLGMFALIVTVGPGLTAPWPVSLLLMNGSIAAVAAVLLWRGQIWPAGDAKLFTVFSIIIPFDFYMAHFTPYFPSFAILINTFFTGLSILTFMVVMDLGRNTVLLIQRGRAGKRDFMNKAREEAREELPVFFKSLMLLMVAFLTTRVLLDYAFSFENDIFSKLAVLQFLITFLLYRQISQFIRKRIPILYCLLFLGAGLFLKLALMRFDFPQFFSYLLLLLRLALLFVAALQALTAAFGFYIKKRQSVYLMISDLKQGMIVDSESWDKLVGEIRQKDVVIGRQLPDGLQAHQIELISGNLPGELTVLVNRTYPFAPILFCGVLLTMLLRQSMLHIILSRL